MEKVTNTEMLMKPLFPVTIVLKIAQPPTMEEWLNNVGTSAQDLTDHWPNWSFCLQLQRLKKWHESCCCNITLVEVGRRPGHKNVHNLFLLAVLALTSRILHVLETCSTTELHAMALDGLALKGREALGKSGCLKYTFLHCALTLTLINSLTLCSDISYILA